MLAGSQICPALQTSDFHSEDQFVTGPLNYLINQIMFKIHYVMFQFK